MPRVDHDLKENKSKALNKIKTLEELAEILESFRIENKKIAHCHGVFDLLHVGHIRHFQEAKKFGDILIVTITPDRYVNKGPHRPAFSEHLRTEVIAALDCVDYVAINKWPQATKAIEILRPHFYVKGSDYKDSEKDHTGGIKLEEDAVKLIGGQIVFTDDIVFSSSSLINRHLSNFSEEVSAYLTAFSNRYSSNDIFKYLDDAKNFKVLVIGEAIIDEYQYCEAIGKSSKEPMLAVKRVNTEKFAGGTLAVANHLSSFVDQVGIITFLGDHNSQEDFIREKLNPKVNPTFLYKKDSPTIVKRRFIESYFFTKMMEVYDINDGTLDSKDDENFCATLKRELPKYDIVIVVDFGHGMFTKKSIELLCKHSKFLAVNAQSNAGNVGYQSIVKYPRADYVCLTENEMRMEARDRRGDLKEMVKQVAQEFDYKRVTVTRGANGCMCYTKSQGFVEVPAFAGKVLDRMGAGDAYLSITALCVAQNAPLEVAGFIGNAVGAQAVATVGHRSFIERAPLYKHIESLLK